MLESSRAWRTVWVYIVLWEGVCLVFAAMVDCARTLMPWSRRAGTATAEEEDREALEHRRRAVLLGNIVALPVE